MGEEQTLISTIYNQLPGQRYTSGGELTLDASELIYGLPAAIYTCDTEGKITFYNAAAAELLGRQPDIGNYFWFGANKIYTADGKPIPVEEVPIALTLVERTVNEQSILMERCDGTIINVLSHARPVFDKTGKIMGAVNILVDITTKGTEDLKISESEIKYRILSESLEQIIDERTLSFKRSEERYHKMIEEVEDYAIILLDKNGYIINWNKGAEKIKGYSEKEIIGQNFRIFYMESDQQVNLPEQLIKEAAEKGKATHEGWRLRKDRTKFWGNIIITALHGEQHDIIGYSKVTRDLTEKKMAEDQLRINANSLQLKNRQLEEYAYVASHDLQEPLRKIRTFASLLAKDITDPEATERTIEKIQSAAERMTDLIKNVLDYSQLSDHIASFSRIDLNKVLDTVKEDFDLLIHEKQVKFQCAHLPDVMGVPIQFYQLFSNLLTNSIKFCMQQPLIEIYSEAVAGDELKNYPDLDAGKHYFKIMYKDNGIGFEQKFAEQIFKLFQRLNNNQNGTGIGLALCKKIVENHHGHIGVTSEPGQGTTFSIYLPVLIPATGGV